MKETLNANSILTTSIKSLGITQQVQSICGIADCTSPRGPYITELYASRNDKLIFKQIHPQGKPFMAIVNGRFAWSVDLDTNRVQQLDSRATAMILGHDLLMLPLIISKRFANPVLIGPNQFADKQCEKVKAIDQWGKSCELFFDKQTLRLAGLIIPNPIGESNETVQLVFTKWEQVTQIFLPKEVVITDKSGDFRFLFRQITLNDVDETLFTVPDEILG